MTAFGYNDKRYTPLNGQKAAVLNRILALLVTHDNHLNANEGRYSGLDVQSRRTANAAMENVITSLLQGKPVDQTLAATLHPRLDTLVQWVKENPSAVPNAAFAESLREATKNAEQIEAFIPEKLPQPTRQH